MLLFKSRKHIKCYARYSMIIISTLVIVLLGVVELNKVGDEEVLTLDFEPIPQKRCCLLQNLPTELIIEVEQDTIDRPYKRFTNQEATMLMKLAKAEAKVDGVEGMCMVMQVVLNRRDNSKFPNTIEGVIYEKSQFSSILDGNYDRAIPDSDCLEALKLIDAGEYDWVDALFFENAESSWQQDTCEYLYAVGHHRFYK